jgi:peroxiredoxin
MKKNYRVVMLLPLLIFNISLYAQQLSYFNIAGHIDGVKDSTVVRIVDIDRQIIIDSALTKSGDFILKGHVDQPSACWLQCMNEYATIQVEDIGMTFQSPIRDMKLNFTAKGGNEQSLQTELDKLQRPYERIYMGAYDSLQNKEYADTAGKMRLIKAFNNNQDKYMDIYVDFGKKHINSYLGLDIVYRNRKRIGKDSVGVLYESLTATLKQTDKAKSLKVFAYETLAQKGSKMLDFDVKTISGQPFKLSSLKGKYIYLAFGSFACGPCRMENKEISKSYAMLSKNMSIVNFSLDVNKKEWLAAAKVDNITWYNVSDMQGDAGKIKTLYGVQAMPTSFLIDPQGIIIEKFEGYNPDNLIAINKILSLTKSE